MQEVIGACLELRQRAVVVDDVVRARPFGLGGPLCGDHRVGVGGAEAAVAHESRAPHVGRGIDDDHPIHLPLEPHFEEQRDIADHQREPVGAGAREGGLPQAFHFGVRDGLEGTALRGVGEDDAAQRRAVEAAVAGEDLAAEVVDDPRQRRGTDRDRLTRELVGRDHPHAVVGEARGHAGLPCGDVAGEADDEHGESYRMRCAGASGPGARDGGRRLCVSLVMPTLRLRGRRAYTLIEILAVVALIGVVLGFAVSRVGFWGLRMDANVRLLQNVIIGAQQTAITKNVNVQVMFDANNHRARILQDYNNNGTMDASDTVRYRPLADGAEFQSPPETIDGVPAAYMTGTGVVETGNPLQRAIRIGPNGALSGDAVIYIGSPRRVPTDFRAMTIIGATARTGFWSRGGGVWRQREN